LYRLKPLLICLAGVLFLYLADGLLFKGLGFICLGYAGYILISRLRWSNTGLIKSKVGDLQVGEQRTYDVRTSKK
jgi:hypothetical protein